MKRDMDLIRAILMKVEDQPAGEDLRNLEDLGSDQTTLAEHVWLLKQEHLIEAVFHGDSPILGNFSIQRLTPAGHDFIAHARQSALWEKAKDTAAKAGVGATVDVMKTLLTGLAAKAIAIAASAL
jgi:hypothetical protein